MPRKSRAQAGDTRFGEFGTGFGQPSFGTLAPSQCRAASPWRVCDIPVTRLGGCFGFRLSAEMAPIFPPSPGVALRCSRWFFGCRYLRIHSKAVALPEEGGFSNPRFPAVKDRNFRPPFWRALLRLGQKKPQAPFETCGSLNLLPYGVAGRAISKYPLSAVPTGFTFAGLYRK
jgi:hypothetical protein